MRFNASRLCMLVGLVSLGMFLRGPTAAAAEPSGRGPRRLAPPDMTRRVDADLPGLTELQGIMPPIGAGNPFSLAASGRSSSVPTGLTAADPARADRVVVEVCESGYDADLTPHNRTITTTTYDRSGVATRLAVERYPYGTEYLGSRYVYTYTYVSRGGDLRSSTWTEDIDGDGTIDSRNTASYEYDQRGHLVGSAEELDDDADGTVDARITATYVNDPRGNPLKSIDEFDYGVDGTVDYRNVSTWEYDSKDRLTRQEHEFENHGTIYLRWTEGYSYDAKGNLVRSVYDETEGTVADRTTRTMTYDSRGLKTKEVKEVYNPADGSIAATDISTFEYDPRGLLVRSELDRFYQGTIRGRVTRAYTYDPDGDLLKLMVDTDAGPDGTVDARETYTYSYIGPRRPADQGGARVTQEAAGAEPSLEMAAPSLAAASPNPFSSEITLRCALSESAPMSLRIYDAAGRLVRTLADGTWDAGEQRAIWDGKDDSGRSVPNGAYFARMRAGGREATATLLRAR